MTLIAPDRLWLLLVAAVLVAVYVVLQRRSRHPAVRHPDVALVATVAPRRAGWRRHLTAGALLLAIVALVLGLARPARSMDEAREEAVIVLAVDISASMGATDVAPDRLSAAIDAATTLVDEAPASYRIGVVTFDTAGHTLATPTTDHDAVVEVIEGLRTNTGTAAGEGLATALDVVDAATADGIETGAGEEPYSAVVLLADGDSTVGRPLAVAAAEAEEAGVPVSTIAYGTDEGTVVIDGATVTVPVDETALAEVATTTGGTAYTATTAEDLDAIYEEIGVRVGTTVEEVELTVALAAVAAGLLAAALVCASIWSPRLV